VELHGILISVREESAAHAIQLLNRLEQLKLQRKELNQKQGIILKDPKVENTIQTVDAEIEKVQGERAKCADRTSNMDTNKT
jgi:hypothetical protein